MIGTKDISITSAADGNSPAITPFIVSGSKSIQCRNGTMSVRYVIFEIVPTRADGIDQKMTSAAIPPLTANFRTMRCHQLRFNADQTTSVGEIPMKRGVIWSGW